MTTPGVQGPARVPTPLPKAPPTASLNPEPASAFSSRMAQQQQQQQKQRSGASGQQQRRGARTSSSDPLSDRTTALLIRRTLYPQQLDSKGRTTPAPIEDVLPPLTSRNDVDLQLYGLFAIILREYVQNWYTKITPDETFVAEILQIVAHCTRALEQRLRKVDLESLLFDEVPDLLDRHITAYRAAHNNAISRPPIEPDPREIYHSFWPLPALSPVPKPDSDDPASVARQAENEAAYRQLLVRGMLAVLLPTEDLENECLTTLVGQIFSELIIGNLAAGKLSEPWFVWELFIILAGIVQRRSPRSANEGDDAAAERDEKLPGEGPTGSYSSYSGSSSSSIQWLFALVLHWFLLATSFVRFLATTVILSRSLPPRASHGTYADATHQNQETGSTVTTTTSAGPTTGPSSGSATATTGAGAASSAGGSTQGQQREQQQQQLPTKTPILAFRCWAAISNLIEMDVRMPWLRGALSLLQWAAMTGPGRIAAVDGVLDRLLSHYIRRYVLDPASLPPLLRNVRGALFPNNAPGTTSLVAPASEAELRALRRRCARALWALVPSAAAAKLYLLGPGGGGLGALLSSSSSSSSLSSSSPSAPSSPPDRPPERVSRDRRQQQQQQQQQDSNNSNSSAPPPPRRTNGTSRGLQGGDGSSISNNNIPGPSSSSGNSNHDNSNDDNNHTTTSNAAGERTAEAADNKVAGGAGGGFPAEGGDDNTDEADEGDDGDEETRILVEIETGILDVFSDAYCNKHLVYGLIELVLVRLMPELAEKGVRELWEERLS